MSADIAICLYRPIPTRSWYGLAHHRRLASPQWPKRLVLPREGVSWELPKTPNIEKETKKVGVGSVAPHHLAKASPLWFWRSFREDVLSPFGMVAKAVRLHSVHELLRVVLSAQNTRGAGVSSFSEHYKSSNAATQPLHQEDRVFAERVLLFKTRRCSDPPRILGQQNDPQELMH